MLLPAPAPAAFAIIDGANSDHPFFSISQPYIENGMKHYDLTMEGEWTCVPSMGSVQDVRLITITCVKSDTPKEPNK